MQGKPCICSFCEKKKEGFMMKKKIVLASIEELKEFNNAAIGCPFEITVTQGKYCVDGKSIMGMFSLNLTSPVTVEYDSDDNECFESVLRKYKAD